MKCLEIRRQKKKRLTFLAPVKLRDWRKLDGHLELLKKYFAPLEKNIHLELKIYCFSFNKICIEGNALKMC